MEQLKFKNALFAVLYCACFITIIVSLGSVICIVGCYVFDGIRNFTYFGIICPSLILGIWIIAGLVILLNTTVIVTSTEIKMCRGNKVKWSIQKSEIQECIYNKNHWYDFIMPISAINAFALQFKLKGKGISRKFCSLSLKQVKRIREVFDYPIKDIDTIYEQ